MMLKLKLQYFGHLMRRVDAGRDWGQEEKGTTEDETAGWHHWLDGRKSEWTPGDGDGQGGLACCDSWGRKELDTTGRLIWSGIKTKALIQHYLRLDRSNEPPPIVPPTLKGPSKSSLFTPVWRNFKSWKRKKLHWEGRKNYTEKANNKCLRQQLFRPINQVKDWRAWVPWLDPTKPFI